ncbi:RimK family alpha-L-glutamate ligase [Planomicrobium sp. YIM 101495]|uniref:ATP-grasp domain-containing protein n=1 Tax=Planomicrobium sp. YIM 101495 TaxID=2665160 RepID=UPI0012B7A5D5|nr:alpha-L-glutamate ligase [Planomicrobium sp. YIM 101495]MTD29658.1 alpha-L-glutamate ligase [Planomicrobium sp. YIM 101495]
MIVLYEKSAAERNKAFIAELARFGDITLETLEDWSEAALAEFAERAAGKRVLFRARRPEAARFLEDRGIQLINRAEVNRIANDKWQAFQLFLLLGVPAIPTSRRTSSFPCVMKTVDGHGGAQVEIIESESGVPSETAGLIFQPVVEHTADVRIYVIGDEVVGAVKRVPADSFKANIALGGTAEKFQLSTEQEQQALKIARALKSDYIGIDFLLLPDGRHLFNEIEDPVGARAFYTTHETNIAELLVRQNEGKDGWL